MSLLAVCQTRSSASVSCASPCLPCGEPAMPSPCHCDFQFAARYIQLDITSSFALELSGISGLCFSVMADEQEIIRAERLTTFEVSPDGSRFCLHVADEG